MSSIFLNTTYCWLSVVADCT